MEKGANKSDLHDVCLNDIEDCLKELFTTSDVEKAGHELDSSLRFAFDAEVPPESILSVLFRALPEPWRSKIINTVAKQNNLSQSDIEDLEAPED
jgi:hypothetical protein